MLNYFKHVLKIIIYSKIQLLPPKKNNVLIFDKVGSNLITILLKKLDKRIKPSILSVRGEEINIFILLNCLFYLNISKKSYLSQNIKYINPKIIITFIDNNLYFHQLSKFYPNIKFIFIQNGWRSYYHDIFEKFKNMKNPKLQNKVDTMLVFGNSIGELYNKYVKGDIHVIGSIKNNLTPIKKNKKQNKKKIIIYVSQWMDGKVKIKNRIYDNQSYSYPCDNFVIPILNKFALKENYNFYILTRSQLKSKTEIEEMEYYKENFGNELEFFDRSKYKNSYEIIDNIDIITGIDSTLLYESLSRNLKTAFFSIRSNLLNLHGYEFGWPDKYSNKGEFWTNIANQEYIYKILYFLHNSKLDKLITLYKERDSKQLMVYDEANSNLFKILKRLIK